MFIRNIELIGVKNKQIKRILCSSRVRNKKGSILSNHYMMRRAISLRFILKMDRWKKKCKRRKKNNSRRVTTYLS